MPMRDLCLLVCIDLLLLLPYMVITAFGVVALATDLDSCS